ncbi:hypothetical protein L916_07889 [Phytophthora nicotianae]|uniref:Uncharacterized protein n=1 Tax=Phytophthora nicotianae TaxID=4792 RepID=W2J624_PHYNI|nr:hypothetical protein L916_07889 [Phytophthora nicotianae]
MIQPLVEEEDEEDDEMDTLEQLEPLTQSTMMTVVELEHMSPMRPRQHLIRRSSSAVERVTMPSTKEEVEDGGDKSLRPRFLQERSATIVHITPQVAEPVRAPRSKASAFLLDVLAKSRGTTAVEVGRLPLEPIRSGVTNKVHYVPQHEGERGIPLRKTGKNRRLGRKVSIGTSSDLMGSGKPERTRERRVSASQEHMTAIVRALQASKQQMQAQLDILHSLLRFINSSARDEHGQRPVLKEMVDVGIIPELASTMREFRFNTSLQVCVMTILSALVEESPLYAYMMSEFNLEKLLQKTVTVHATQDRVVMLASNLVRAIEDSKHTVNIPAYLAEKAAKASQQSSTYTDTVVAAITAKPRQSFSSPSPTAKSARSLALISNASSSEKRGLEMENINFKQSAGRQRQAFSLDLAPPALNANYRLLTSQKLKKAEDLQLPADSKKILTFTGNHQDRRDRPLTSSTRKPLPLDLTSRSLATAIYSGGSIFVEPSPLSKRLSFRGSFSAGGVRRKLSIPKNIQRAHTERLPPTQISNNWSPAQTFEESAVSSRIKSMDVETSLAKDKPIVTDTKESDEYAEGEISVKNQEKEESNEKEESGKEEEDESYEDDFDTTGDDADEVKSMPSRQGSSQLGSDGELIDMLTEINAATTIQCHVRGLLVRREYANKNEPSKNAEPGLGKKASRVASGGKSGRRGSKTKGINGKRASFSARHLQNHSTRKLESLRTETGIRSATRTRPATAVSARPFTSHQQILNSKQGSVNDGIGVRQRAANLNDLQRGSNKLSHQGPSMSKQVFSSTRSLNEVEPEHKTGESDVANEPPDPESLKQIQTLYAEGLQHHKENHLGLAIDCYEKALALPGGQSFASLHVNLGSALMAQTKFSEALESFKQAKRIQPNNVKAIYNYSVALLHLDRPQEAQHLLRRILELDPTHEKATIALSHLRTHVGR